MSHVSILVTPRHRPDAAVVAVLFVIVFPFLTIGLQAQTSVITLNGAGGGRVFDGVGAVSAGGSSRLLIDYPEPYRTQVLDYLFKPHYGASLQSLKVEIGGDVDSSGGSEPSHMRSPGDGNYARGYEWWLMNEAKRRNPGIQLGALAWGAPGWLGGGQYYSQDTIDYIVAFLRGARTTYGFDIDYVGIWNETPYDTQWIKSLKGALSAAGLPTRIVAADQASDQWNIVNDMYADPALMAAVDIVGEHYVHSQTPLAAQSLGKPLWDSEDGPWRGDWTGAASIARLLNRNYIDGRLTKTEIWSPVTSYYDVMTLSGSGLMYANTPWSGYYEVQPAIWAMAHTTQFAGPGWRYIDESSGYLGASSYVTLQDAGDYTVVIETMDEDTTRDATLYITGGLSLGTVHVWRSNAQSQFVRLADIAPVGGAFTIRLEPGSIYSLTTTSGQMKGSAAPPVRTPFAVPFGDDFEGYGPGRTPRYLSDIDGAFETAACAGGRSGECLRQIVTTPPIPWRYAGLSEPASLVGAPSLVDYAVSADVLFEQDGNAKLIGRLTSKEQASGYVNGYQFYVGSSGEWSLRIADWLVIASGSIAALPLHTWHAVRLVMEGPRIQGVIDGVTVVDLRDETYVNGLAGVGVGSWTNAQFDNFRIDAVATTPPSSSIAIPQSQMRATATSEAVNYEAAKALDGDLATFWTTGYVCTAGCQPTDPLPQSIVLHLGGTYAVTTVRYLPRQDGNPNGAITSYRIHLSTDGVSWRPVAAGTWAEDASEKRATFAPGAASYLWLEALQGGSGYAGAAEIHVEYAIGGSPATNPVPAITGIGPATVSAGAPGLTLTVSGNGFVGSAVVQVDGSARPTTFIDSQTVTAALPASDLASAGTRTITVFNPAPGGGLSNASVLTVTSGGPASIAIPQWQMTATATSEAVNYEAAKALDGDLATFWTTGYVCAAGCQPTDPLPQSIVLRLGGTYAVTTVRYLPRQDGNPNGAITSYRIRLSTNGVTWTPLAEGTWAGDASEKRATFAPGIASYLWLEALQGDNGYAGAAEINVEYKP